MAPHPLQIGIFVMFFESEWRKPVFILNSTLRNKHSYGADRNWREALTVNRHVVGVWYHVNPLRDLYLNGESNYAMAA